MCCSSLFSIVVKDSKDKVLLKANLVLFSTKTGNYCYIIRCHKLHSACISTTSGPIFTN